MSPTATAAAAAAAELRQCSRGRQISPHIEAARRQLTMQIGTDASSATSAETGGREGGREGEGEGVGADVTAGTDMRGGGVGAQKAPGCGSQTRSGCMEKQPI